MADQRSGGSKLQLSSLARVPGGRSSGFKPQTLHQMADREFGISDLEGQLWLLTALVGVTRNRERSDGLLLLYGYLHRTMPSARREDKE